MNKRSTRIPAGIMLLVGLALAWPSLGSAATCTISPANPTINMGGTVPWAVATRSGFPSSGTYTYAWTFPGGNPSNRTSATGSVSYAAAGSSTTSLTLTRSGTTATCTSTVTVNDTQAPTVPGNVTATPAGATQINLAWSASTDNVGVTGYRVERCTGSTCTNFAQIAAPTTTSYSDTGRTASTTYRYRVRAADARGNLSPYSTIRNATTTAGFHHVTFLLTFMCRCGLTIRRGTISPLARSLGRACPETEFHLRHAAAALGFHWRSPAAPPQSPARSSRPTASLTVLTRSMARFDFRVLFGKPFLGYRKT